MSYSNGKKDPIAATDQACHCNVEVRKQQQPCLVGFLGMLKLLVLVSAAVLMILQSFALMKAFAILKDIGEGVSDIPSAGFSERKQVIFDTSTSKESVLLPSSRVETPLPSCCTYNASQVRNNHGKKALDSIQQINQCRQAIDKKWQYNHKPDALVTTFDFDALIAATKCSAVEIKPEENMCFEPSPYFQEIARIPAPRDYKEMQVHTTRAIPVIFTGYNKDSTMWSWTMDSLHEKLGHHTMRVRHGEYESLESRVQTKMTVGDFVDMVRGRKERPDGLPPYLGNNQLSKQLIEEFVFEPIDILYHDTKHNNKTSLWAGAAGTKTPLHKDTSDNYAYMIAGTKEWTIFPPEDIYTLKCFRCAKDKHVDWDKGGNKMNGLCWCPQGVIEDGDCLPPGSQPYTFELHEGEVMYLPAGWLHSVRNLDETIMINRWMRIKDVAPHVVWDSQLPEFWSSASK